MNKIRISAVSYLNTIPFIYGMENNKDLLSIIEWSKDIPSECARKLLNDEVDVGLVPVAIIPKLQHPKIISDYCIGANGKVDSVLLLSDVPLHKIEKIILDYQSRTSINLCKILCREFWKIKVDFTNASSGYEDTIGGTTAAVVIGDRTFQLPKKFKYQYDLAEEWNKMTQLPFVFAAWVSNKELPQKFIDIFNHSLAHGLKNIEAAVDADKSGFLNRDEKIQYLRNRISYLYDEEKKMALKKFLSLLEA